jgi:WD40 repeat protein
VIEESSTEGEIEFDFQATHVRLELKHTAPLIGCRFDPTGRFAFASSMDHTVQRWHLDSGAQTQWQGHDGWLRAIGFSPDGSRAFTGGYDGKLCFWDTKSDSPQPLHAIDAHQGWIRWLAVQPGGKLLATAGNDLAVRLWAAESGELIRTLQGHEKHVYSLLFDDSGDLLLSGDLAGVVKVWEVATGDEVKTIDAKGLHLYHGGQRVDYGGVRCMAFSPDRTQLACGGLHKGSNPFAGVQEPLVLVFDWETGEQVRTHEATEITRGIIWRLGFLPDGTLLGASGGGSGGFLLFWGPEKTQVHKFKLSNTVLDMDLRLQDRDVLTAHYDGRLRISRMAQEP